MEVTEVQVQKSSQLSNSEPILTPNRLNVNKSTLKPCTKYVKALEGTLVELKELDLFTYKHSEYLRDKITVDGQHYSQSILKYCGGIYKVENLYLGLHGGIDIEGGIEVPLTMIKFLWEQ